MDGRGNTKNMITITSWISSRTGNVSVIAILVMYGLHYSNIIFGATSFLWVVFCIRHIAGVIGVSYLPHLISSDAKNCNHSLCSCMWYCMFDEFNGSPAE